ncbi:MAG: hypothetical protein Q4F41_04260 [Eubacteriales bacterium]|nr:hypothetical protein [Eubacteriales bacterium]
MKTFDEAFQGKTTSHILPFLWMRGEDNALIGQELDKIQECGISEVCLESRPHPEFAGPLWWKNLDYILAEARKRDMRVWVLDDDKFPTGHCNSALETKYPELAKTYLAERHMDIYGPCRCNAVLVENFLGADGKLLGILACPKPDGETLAVSGEGIIDLTENYQDGFVYFDLPEGAYRLFILFLTQQGGGRPGYVNLIDSKSVQVLISEVYEKHYEHYSEYFGKEFAGFFSDEPELGNVPGYPFDCAVGQKDTKLPWSEELREALTETWGGEFLANLIALWYERGEKTDAIRYTYMDEMTKLVRKCFSGQLGAWCAAHQVEYIGHVLEDDNSHNKLGCGIGHYFREMEGQHMAGVDVVHHQIVPGFTETYHQWIAGDKDGEFFHFGLAKMGSSAAHIDPKKKNRALCEVFGNYGWAEGLPLMRWLTDHMLVRGINEFTPHAFSMRYPDPDCPPHFYAGGHNPQFEGFTKLMKYMNRVASILAVGEHQAQAAVLYHGDMEWNDPEAMLFQKPVRALMEAQLDCDVIPCDVFADGRAQVKEGKLAVCGKEYPCVVIPGCRYLPKKTAEFLADAAESGLPVYVASNAKVSEHLLEGCSEGGELPERFLDAVRTVSLRKLPGAVAALGDAPVRFAEHDPGLRVYCTRQTDGLVCMLFNENVSRQIETKLRIGDSKELVVYDAWENRAWRLPVSEEGAEISIMPGNSVLIFAGEMPEDLAALPMAGKLAKEIPVETDWKVARKPWGTEEFLSYQNFSAKEPLPNLNGPGYDPKFVGTYAYEGSFTLEMEAGASYSLKLPEVSDVAKIWINGEEAALLGTFPGRTEITRFLKDGRNDLHIEVTTTLIWERKDGASTHLQIPASGMTKQPVLEVWK